MRFTWKTHAGRWGPAHVAGAAAHSGTDPWVRGDAFFGVQGVVGRMCFVWMVFSLHSDLQYTVHVSRVTLSCPRAVTTYRT